MSFHEIRFPTRISYGAVGGPRFSTTVQVLNSGHEQRNINWAQARREYSVDVSPSRGRDWDEILTFFHGRRGRAYGFRLKDFSDYKVSNGIIGTGDGSATEFQIVKQYQDALSVAEAFERPLSKIVENTISVFLNDVAQFGNWTVDVDTGLISFSAAPAALAVVSVSCEFDVPVRFDDDLMEAAIPGPDIHHWQSVKLVEIRQ